MKLCTQRIFLLLLFFVVSKFSIAQLFSQKNYPKFYFQWPVGARVGVVANFGELRNNHYHMGLDIRTDQKVNVPVYAAADGYVAKVKIEPFGFGRCIYINHPNGYTTLYAHLNNFTPALEKYISELQYGLKRWNVFVDIPPTAFPVKKGDFIAFSGSTGGSQGPHVHFEIRDTKTDKVLNPMLFGMPVPDNVPPVILRLAVYDRNFSTYEQTPKLYALKKVNGIYKPVGGNIQVNSNKVSFAISAYDRFSGSSNPNGIFSAELFDNDKTVCGFEMDNISYDETRYLNAHIDYKTRSSGGPYLQHLSRLPGYADGIYQSLNGSDGVIHLADSGSHQIKIVVSDADDNNSTIEFLLTAKEAKNTNTIAYATKMFLPGYVNVFEDADVNFYLPEGSLYDSFRINFKKTIPAVGRPVYQLHNGTVPVHNYFPVKIHDNFALEDSSRMVMKRFYAAKDDYKKAVYEDGWYKASFREFGNYQLIPDNTPPVITPIGFKNGMKATRLNRIAFSVTDNTEEIINFIGLLDGNWIRFSNDKGKVFIYLFDEHCGPGEHELKIVAEDLAGNRSERIYTFTR